jgi:hypothetical protein
MKPFGINGAGRMPSAVLYLPPVLLATATTAALCLWIVLWSIGVKALDGMILVLLIVVVAAGIKILSVYLPSHRSE